MRFVPCLLFVICFISRSRTSLFSIEAEYPTRPNHPLVAQYVSPRFSASAFPSSNGVLTHTTSVNFDISRVATGVYYEISIPQGSFNFYARVIGTEDTNYGFFLELQDETVDIITMTYQVSASNQFEWVYLGTIDFVLASEKKGFRIFPHFAGTTIDRFVFSTEQLDVKQIDKETARHIDDNVPEACVMSNLVYPDKLDLYDWKFNGLAGFCPSEQINCDETQSVFIMEGGSASLNIILGKNIDSLEINILLHSQKTLTIDISLTAIDFSPVYNQQIAVSSSSPFQIPISSSGEHIIVFSVPLISDDQNYVLLTTISSHQIASRCGDGFVDCLEQCESTDPLCSDDCTCQENTFFFHDHCVSYHCSSPGCINCSGLNLCESCVSGYSSIGCTSCTDTKFQYPNCLPQCPSQFCGKCIDNECTYCTDPNVVGSKCMICKYTSTGNSEFPDCSTCKEGYYSFPDCNSRTTQAKSKKALVISLTILAIISFLISVSIIMCQWNSLSQNVSFVSPTKKENCEKKPE